MWSQLHTPRGSQGRLCIQHSDQARWLSSDRPVQPFGESPKPQLKLSPASLPFLSRPPTHPLPTPILKINISSPHHSHLSSSPSLTPRASSPILLKPCSCPRLPWTLSDVDLLQDLYPHPRVAQVMSIALPVLVRLCELCRAPSAVAHCAWP